jgi:hypothetical protein
LWAIPSIIALCGSGKKSKLKKDVSRVTSSMMKASSGHENPLSLCGKELTDLQVGDKTNLANEMAGSNLVIFKNFLIFILL